MADVWNNTWGSSWAVGAWATFTAPTNTSGVSLSNIPSLNSGTSIGLDKLDAMFVGKGTRT